MTWHLCLIDDILESHMLGLVRHVQGMSAKPLNIENHISKLQNCPRRNLVLMVDSSWMMGVDV